MLTDNNIKRFVRKIFVMFLMGVTCMAVAFPVPAMADEDDASGYGEVTFNFHVDSTLSGAEMCMYFMDVDTLEIRTVTTRDYKSGTITVTMPCGTYEFGCATFDGDMSLNYTNAMSCDTFTVTEDGTTYSDGETCAVISTTMRVVVSVPIDCTFHIYGTSGATVQLWLAGESDAVYAEGPQDIPQQEEYSIVVTDDEGTSSIDAGEFTVTDIRAYNADHKPLNVYYPASLTVDRITGLADGQEYALYVYDDDALDGLTDAEQKNLWQDGYRLMLSDDTPEYSPSYYDRKVISYDVASGQSDGSDTGEIDVSGFEVEIGDYEEADDLKGIEGFSGRIARPVRFTVMIIVLTGAALVVVHFIIKKKESKED